MSEPPSSPPEPERETLRAGGGRSRKILRAAAAALVAFLLAGGAAELALRSALFGDGLLAAKLGGRLRRASLYADGRFDEDNWKLRFLFHPDTYKPASNYDPSVGWCGKRIDVDSCLLASPTPRPGGRKAVLFFGDSFAECTTARDDCFEWIFERSPLGERFALLNYGVGGYGLDQTYLMVRKALATLPFERPIIVVSVLVDSDLDRCEMAFRDWPKPRFPVEGGALGEPAPVAASAAEHLAEDPVQITSYVWRYLVHGTGVLPARWKAVLGGEVRAAESTRERTALLIEALQRELEDRGLRYFFLVFNGRESFEQGELHSWREPLLHEVFAELEVPFVSTRHDIRADALATGSDWRDYFIWELPALGHYNPRGNAVAFRAIERGFREEFEAPTVSGHPR